MKKILIAASLIAASAATAGAADLAARTYTKAPPPTVAAIYDWSGFYIGANGGWGSRHRSRTDVPRAIFFRSAGSTRAVPRAHPGGGRAKRRRGVRLCGTGVEAG